MSVSSNIQIAYLVVEPMHSVFPVFNSAVVEDWDAVLGTGLLPRISISQPIVWLFNLTKGATYQFYCYGDTSMLLSSGGSLCKADLHTTVSCRTRSVVVEAARSYDASTPRLIPGRRTWRWTVLNNHSTFKSFQRCLWSSWLSIALYLMHQSTEIYTYRFRVQAYIVKMPE